MRCQVNSYQSESVTPTAESLVYNGHCVLSWSNSTSLFLGVNSKHRNIVDIYEDNSFFFAFYILLRISYQKM